MDDNRYTELLHNFDVPNTVSTRLMLRTVEYESQQHMQAVVDNLLLRIELLEIDMKSGDYEALYAQVVQELNDSEYKYNQLVAQFGLVTTTGERHVI